MFDHLLPSNATEFERSASLAMDSTPRVNTAVGALRTAKRVNIPDALLPWLVYEYGLGPVTPFVPDLRHLIAEGIGWQRVRGTPAAVALGLGWVGYTAEIEEAPTVRRLWHRFQLGLDRVRDQEEPDLAAIAGITELSVAVRSEFWRGFSGYDVREAEWSRRRWSGARWSESSGVRIPGVAPKWSFGRGAAWTVLMEPDDLISLDAWQEPVGGTLGWGQRAFLIAADTDLRWGAFTWDASAATWTDLGEEARLHLITSAMSARPVWVAFRDADGALIGCRRARAARPVTVSIAPAYEVDGLPLAPAEPGTSFYVDALTDFGDGYGAEAATVSLIWDSVPVDPARPGLLWAGPGDLTPGTEILSRPYPAVFGRTVRERIRFHLII